MEDNNNNSGSGKASRPAKPKSAKNYVPKHVLRRQARDGCIRLAPLSRIWKDEWHRTDYEMNERRTEHKQMVVLDLNGTLLWRGPRKDDRSRNAYPRPHLGELLQFLADNFAVMVWSSAQPDSVHEMMTKILAPHYQQFVRVWDRRYCDLDGEYFSKAKTVKDLNRICNGFSLEDSPNRDVYKTYNGYKGACVDTKDRWMLENMLIVDDSESKTELQKDNHIFVSTFESPIERKSAGLPPDDELLKLRHYLELYTRQKDTYPNLLAYLTAHPWIAFRDASSDNRKQQSQ